MKVKVYLLDRSFKDRRAVRGAHTRAKAFGIVKIERANQTFDDTFLLFLCLRLIKISAYSRERDDCH